MMTDIAILETLNPVDVFQSEEKAQDILSQIEKDARAAAALLDVTTEAGRKEMKSLAYKVSRSKTAIDEAGKRLQADAKAVVDRVNAGRRLANERLDELRDEVKAPAVEFDAREAARVQAHRDRIAKIELIGQRLSGLSVDCLNETVEELDLLAIGGFEEFKNRAELAVDQTRNALKAAIIIAEKEEADRKEAERLAAIAAEEARIAAEEARKAREELIAKEAAEKAKAEAEAKAERGRQAIKAAWNELEKRRVNEHEAAIRWIKGMAADASSPTNSSAMIEHISGLFESMKEITRDYEEFQAQADEAIKAGRAQIKEHLEAIKKYEAQRAEAAKKEAEEKAARDQAEVIEKERQRIADEKAAQEAEDARRAANKAHRGKINREVLAGLMELGLSEVQGKAVIGAILGGSVPHVMIGY